MLDEDFNTKMADLAKIQQEANDAHARAIQSMAADLSDMCGRFEREMRAERATTDGHSDDSGTPGTTVRGQADGGGGEDGEEEGSQEGSQGCCWVRVAGRVRCAWFESAWFKLVCAYAWLDRAKGLAKESGERRDGARVISSGLRSVQQLIDVV
ncbi:hypothetical protein DL766_002848 [Monosporascus sp. MC13-8B]|nr:hypothetical protein DL766_002848 [Monosporascus sp. MC13-8B]